MSKIPKILHYVFGMMSDFGGKPWSLIHHVCVASAIERIRPDAAFLYYEYEPSGPWWELSKKLLTPVQIKAPTEIYGRPLLHPAHRAGVVRLQTLIREGGIYLDADVLVQKSFDDLLDSSAVVGQQDVDGSNGIADAILLGEKDSSFLRRWLDTYRTFRSTGRDQYWAEHAVFTAPAIAAEYPEEVTVLPYKAFYWPLYYEEHIKWIFASDTDIDLSQTYANHLWETFAWPYVNTLTPGRIRAIDTNFNKWARPFVADLPDDFARPGEQTPIAAAMPTSAPTNLDAKQFLANYFAGTPAPRLEIGAGGERKAGWLATDLYASIDSNGGPIFDMDATQPFPFPDGTFSYVYSEHMIEHIPLNGALSMLQESLRVLRPGGTIRIVTPSIGMLLKAMSPDRTPFEANYISWALQNFSGHQPLATSAVFFNNFVRDWGHQFIYDRQTLVELMRLAGFEHIRECTIGQSREALLSDLEKVHRLPSGFLEFESMIFEGRKTV